jgi:hypothetical protein
MLNNKMMNTFIKYSLLVSVFMLLACAKEKPIFDKSPDERKIETLAAYKKQLIESPEGWIIYVSSGTSGATQQFWCKFNENGEALLQDMDGYRMDTVSKSKFYVSISSSPSLVFYVGSLLSKRSSVLVPDLGDVFSNSNLDRIDFEFVFDKVSTDTITLVGSYSKSPTLMIRASAAEKEKHFNEYYSYRRKLFSIAGEFGSPIKKYTLPFIKSLSAIGFSGVQDVMYNYTLTLMQKPYIFFINPVKSIVQIAEKQGDGSYTNLKESGYYYSDLPSKGFKLVNPIKLANGSVIYRLSDFKRLSIGPITTDTTDPDIENRYTTISMKINDSIDVVLAGKIEKGDGISEGYISGFFIESFVTGNLF